MSQTKTSQSFALASVALLDAYTDFKLSRQAMNCTPVTTSFYRFTAGKFLEWIEQQGLTSPEQITARHVRQLLAELTSRGLQDTTRHDYARAIRTLTILSLHAGMNALHVQNLGGLARMDMVQHYLQMMGEDLLRENKAHSPVDDLFRLKEPAVRRPYLMR